MKQTNLQLCIMDIAQNLARIGNWTADNFAHKKDLIQFFLTQTNTYIEDLKKYSVNGENKILINYFLKEYDQLKNQKITLKNKEIWAEKALTWANILQHQAKLA